MKVKEHIFLADFNIDESQILTNVKKLIINLKNTLDNLLDKFINNLENVTYDNFVKVLNFEENKLDNYFSIVSHLHNVKNTEILRNEYSKSVQEMSKYGMEIMQNEKVFKIYKKIEENCNLNKEQKKVIENTLKGFFLAGVDLSKDKKEAFKAIKIKLIELSNKFSNNVLDATMSYKFFTNNKSDLDGLSQYTISMAQDKAKLENKKGFENAYCLGLDMPTYLSIMMNSTNRDLREKFYYEYSSRCSNFGEFKNKFDNTKIIEEILNLRQKQANILGFENYANLSVFKKMAESTDIVVNFLKEIGNYAKPKAQKELQKLQEFATSLGFNENLQPWDIAFYSEKLKKKLFDFNEEELKVYFPLKKVLNGLFVILKNIYGLEIKEEENFNKYDNDLRLFSFYDEDKVLRGLIYVDLYARDSKQGGAWMDVCRNRFLHNDDLQIPIAYVTCNFAKPEKNKIATLKHNDVTTLFHEFGHALQHILTKVNELEVSGISGVEWDAVELPSQFMENYCWHKDGIKLISEHIETKKELPEHLFKKLIESRNFHTGMFNVRQIEFGLFDFLLHLQNYKSENIKSVQTLLDDVRNDFSLIKAPEYNKFQNSFAHIFAGGYSAGYFSYKWAEVLSCEAFEKFVYENNILSRKVGTRFLKSILEKGGSDKALNLFKDFLGKDEISIKPLLKYTGLV